jgi:hypothetical protein
MSKFTRRCGLLAGMMAGLLALDARALAQFNFNPNLNPNFVPGLNRDQYMAWLQQTAQARMAAQAQMFQPVVPVNPLPAAVSPYTPVTASPYGTPVTSPYNPVAPGISPYDSAYINPYYAYADPYGGVLRGTADVMRAYGTVITSQEQARIMREQYYQSKLDTKKKKFDLEMYIKANTPTFTEEQAKIAKMTLKRIQTNSSEPEIINGKSLNLLLDDLRKQPGKKLAVEPFALSEDVLGHLNVTKGGASLGILRNGGEFTWPVALQEHFSAEQLKLIENQAKTLVKNSAKGKLDVNVLKDMRTEVDKIRDQLSRKVNEVPTTQYLEAKRFLNDFDDARQALERGETMTHVNFQKWAAGGKNLQQLVDYMVSNGLKFTPATQGDEFAYRAAYSGLVALDVAHNHQGGYVEQQQPMEQKENP